MTIDASNECVLLLTSSFPYPGGEQFLEAEMNAWAARGPVRILPIGGSQTPRDVPDNVLVDESLIHAWSSKTERIKGLGRVLASPLFWRDLLDGSRRRGLSSALVIDVVKAQVAARVTEKVVRQVTTDHAVGLVYSYWSGPLCWGAALGSPSRTKVVTRTHRNDLYEDARRSGYQPMIRIMHPRIDRFFPISDDGRDYLISAFGVPSEKISVARLGVDVPPKITQEVHDEFRVISTSTCKPVKRVPRIAETVSELARSRPKDAFSWVHLGGHGPLFDELTRIVELELDRTPNLSVRLTGQLENQEVLTELHSGSYDCFVNMSSSEGIPVSIMEALAAGVPVMATQVGAVDELVSEEVGALIPSDCSIGEASRALGEVLDRRGPEIRDAARAVVIQDYEATSNYAAFVRQVLGSGA